MSIPSSVIVFPDIEAWTITVLGAALPGYFAKGVRLAGKYNPDAAEPYQVIPRRDGGPRLDVVRELNRINLNVYGTDGLEGELVDLCRVTAAILIASPDATNVVKVEQISGPITVPDTMPRRLVGMEITARGSQRTPTP